MISPEHIILLYGKGGLGKSTLVAQAAAHVYKGTGLITRVLGADGGGNKPFKVLIDKGIVEYCPIDLWNEKSIFHTLDLVTQGYWPEDPASPNSNLLAPTKSWKPCPKCKADSGAFGLAMVEKCAACGEKFPAGLRISPKVEFVNGAEKVGCYAFEGATSFGVNLLNALKRADPDGGRSIKDGDTIVSAPGQQHYMDAQNYIAQFIGNSRRIPAHMVLWTALERRGQDEDKKPVYGPSLPGKALTEACIPWFTDVLHLDGMPKAGSTKDANGQEILERKLYLETHFPADTKPYGFAAKTSTPLSPTMPRVLDALATRNNMSTFFSQLEAAYKDAEQLLLG